MDFAAACSISSSGLTKPCCSLHGIRFSRDVTVDGHATLVYDGQGVTMELMVHGPRGRVGTLAAEGAFGPGEPFEAFSVTGVLGGRTVSASVPAN